MHDSSYYEVDSSLGLCYHPRMNTKLMFSSKRGDWETPQALFDQLEDEFHFDLDVCASHENTKCLVYHTLEGHFIQMDPGYTRFSRDNGLEASWKGTCWMNPPYGREIRKWVKKAHDEAQKGATIVCLLPARTDTKWFHEWIYGKAEIRFIKGRLKFVGAISGAPFPSMVVIFRPQ